MSRPAVLVLLHAVGIPRVVSWPRLLVAEDDGVHRQWSFEVGKLDLVQLFLVDGTNHPGLRLNLGGRLVLFLGVLACTSKLRI